MPNRMSTIAQQANAVIRDVNAIGVVRSTGGMTVLMVETTDYATVRRALLRAGFALELLNPDDDGRYLTAAIVTRLR